MKKILLLILLIGLLLDKIQYILQYKETEKLYDKTMILLCPIHAEVHLVGKAEKRSSEKNDCRTLINYKSGFSYFHYVPLLWQSHVQITAYTNTWLLHGDSASAIRFRKKRTAVEEPPISRNIHNKTVSYDSTNLCLANFSARHMDSPSQHLLRGE